MSLPSRGVVECRYTTSDGEDVVASLSAARAEDVVQGRPVRAFRWYAGMTHYPGWLWSVTMGDLVGYESLMERDRLLLADFDRDVVAIANHPFGLVGPDGDEVRKHVPDYLLCCRDGSVIVVDVKPAAMLDVPKVSEVLGWTGRVIADRGWRFEVWSGADPIRLANVRFMGQGRRWERVDQNAAAALLAAGASGMTLDDALSSATKETGILLRADLRAAMLALLWRQVWVVDLDVPLSGLTRIQRLQEVPDVQRSA